MQKKTSLTSFLERMMRMRTKTLMKSRNKSTECLNKTKQILALIMLQETPVRQDTKLSK